MALILNVDGGSRGNPGPAGAGVVLRAADDGLIHEAGYFLGRQTNNAAEYHALIRGLQRAQRCGDRPLTIRSDSELLVRQLTGEYRVKSPALAELFEQAQLLLLKVSVWKAQHVPREQNRRADHLANMAMDRGADVIVFDVDGPAPADAAGAAPRPRQAHTSSATGGVPPQPAGAPPAAGAPPVVATGPRSVLVTSTTPPDRQICPAPDLPAESFAVGATLPGGLCLHAAHALTPTVLAVLGTAPQEFAAVPTLTVRCMKAGCGATFHIAPLRSPNGSARD